MIRSTTTVSAGALVILTAMASASACREPTQATIEIVSEVAYRPDVAVSVQLGSIDDVESAAPRVISRGGWAADGTVGTVVALPRTDPDVFAVRVVLAVGREPSTCSAVDAKGCIVVRRTARFVPGEASRLRIVLRPTCLGAFCDATTSCARDGQCGSLESDQATSDGGIDGEAPHGDDPYAVEVLADRPRHYYRFDEPPQAPLARDAVGRADGRYEGGITLGITGALGSSPNTAAYFDGRDASVVVPTLADLPGACSFEAWVRADGPTTDPDPTIFERLDRVGNEAFGYRFSKPAGTLAAFAVFRGSLQESASARAFRFAGYSHVVAVSLGGEIELYVDGLLSGSASFADAPPPALLAPFVVGMSRTGGAPWRGAIDELAIYDYPLSVEQMKRHRLAAGEP